MIGHRELQRPSCFSRSLVWMLFGVFLICVLFITPLRTETRYEVGKILELKTRDLQAPAPFFPGTTIQVPFATDFQFQVQASNIIYIAGCIAEKGNYDLRFSKE